MKMYYAILPIFILVNQAWSQAPQASGQCNTDELDLCVKPIGMDPGGPLGQQIQEPTLIKVCGDLPAAKSCFAQKSSKCYKMELLQQQSAIDVAEYVCTEEGKKGLLGMQSCFTKPDFYPTFSAALASLSPIMSTMDPAIVGKICHQNNAMLACYVNASKICNSEAFVTTVYKKMTGKKMEMYGCEISVKNWDTKAYSQCNTTKMAECAMQGMHPDLMPYIQNPMDMKILGASPEQFNKACSVVDNVMKCITKDAKCEEKIPIVEIGVGPGKGLEHICKTDRAGYDKLAKCYSSNSKVFDECVKFQPHDCSSYAALQKCLADAAKKSCGNSSTIDHYFYKKCSPMFKQALGCQLVQPGLTGNGAEMKYQPFFLLFIASFFMSYI